MPHLAAEVIDNVCAYLKNRVTANKPALLVSRTGKLEPLPHRTSLADDVRAYKQLTLHVAETAATDAVKRQADLRAWHHCYQTEPISLSKALSLTLHLRLESPLCICDLLKFCTYRLNTTL